MSIKKCTCKHDGQDKLHGKGMRVHNKTKIGKGSTEVSTDALYAKLRGSKMPYRISPKNKTVVQVKKNNRWTKLKKHPSKEKARKHLAALKINVKH